MGDDETGQEEEILQSLLPDSTTNNNNGGNNDSPPNISDPVPPSLVSRNIPIMLWYQFLRSGPESIWLSSVLSAYVFLLRPNNPELVGYLSAIEGITQFAFACAAGVLADMYRRDVLLKISSVIGAAAGASIVWAAARESIVPLGVGLGLNGAFDGIALTATLALFADSIADGERSYYFTQRTLRTSLGQFVGPVFGLVLFLIQGDQWSVRSCARVMIIAQFLLVPAFAFLWFFRDVEKEEEGAPTILNDSAESQGEDASYLLLSTDGPEGTAQDCSSQQSETTHHCNTPFGCLSKDRSIVACCAGSDVICSVANGISLRYFTIFFLKDLHWGPVLVQVLDALSRLIGSGLLLIAQRASLRYGRCPVSVAFKTAGVLALLAMVLTYSAHGHRRTPTAHAAIGILYLLQNAFLNSTGALTRSLIMDHVPPRERARWSALESINIFGWSCSPAIGGAVVGYFGGDVLPVFFLTAGLQVVGSVPLVALFRTEEREERRGEEGEE